MALTASLATRCSLLASSRYSPPRSQLSHRQLSGASLRTTLSRRPAQESQQQRHRLCVRAEEDSTRKLVNSALSAGNQALDAAVGFLPASVPKPIGKAGLGLLGLTISLSLIQALFNSFVTLLFLGGIGYLGFTYLSKGGSKSAASGDDPLDEARKIMDKYK